METYVKPNVPIRYWYVNIYKDWLKIHDQHVKGNVSEMRENNQDPKERYPLSTHITT